MTPARVSLVHRLREDHLLSNSLYLMLNSILQAGAGFVFWVISARLFSVGDVGLATALFSALGLICFTSLLGLNSTVVRYLPVSSQRSVLITSTLSIVSGCGGILALVYLVIMPVISPKLAFVTHNPAMAVGFVFLAVAGSVNLLTDSIFIGLRQARFNALVDGVFGGVAKIVAALAVAGTGAYGLFVASVVGYVVAAVASLVLIGTFAKVRVSLRGARAVLQPLLRFSAANYVGNLLTLLPTFVVPLIVLDRVGVHASAYYYIAYLMVSLLFAAVFAVEQTFLAEGSQAGADLRAVMRRSWRLLALFCIPATVLLALGAHWLLLLFGRRVQRERHRRADRIGDIRYPPRSAQLAPDRPAAHWPIAADRDRQCRVRCSYLWTGLGTGPARPGRSLAGLACRADGGRGDGRHTCMALGS